MCADGIGLLEGVRELQDARVAEMTADELELDRESVGCEASRYRYHRWLPT